MACEPSEADNNSGDKGLEKLEAVSVESVGLSCVFITIKYCSLYHFPQLHPLVLFHFLLLLAEACDL